MGFLIKVLPDPKDALKRADLLKECFAEYFRTENPFTTAVNPDCIAEMEISRSEKGKPYFSEEPWSGMKFSISHSDGMWACVIGSRECGIDVQKKRQCRYLDIAVKHFFHEEVEYVREKGPDGFYELWTRREALAKYTGLGFFGMADKRPSLVNGEGTLNERVVWDGCIIRFYKMEVVDGFEGVWCTEEEQ